MMNDHAKAFGKLIGQMSGRHELWRIFSDFCELSALSLDNVFPRDPAREDRYKATIERYEPETRKGFTQLFAIVVEALDAEPEQDFLGGLFMSLELSSHWKGQFFTPMPVCRVMADVTIGDDFPKIIAERGFVTVSEPACGAGATLIGLCAALRARGINYQETIHVTAVDVDATAAHMCFIQLSLLHVPAVVVVGNTLALEERDRFHTPAHHMGLWDWKLRSDGHVTAGSSQLHEAILSQPPANEGKGPETLTTGQLDPPFEGAA